MIRHQLFSCVCIVHVMVPIRPRNRQLEVQRRNDIREPRALYRQHLDQLRCRADIRLRPYPTPPFHTPHEEGWPLVRPTHELLLKLQTIERGLPVLSSQ